MNLTFCLPIGRICLNSSRGLQEVARAQRGRGVQGGTKKRIIHVATELFAQRGYDACSVAEIANRSGVSKPVLYYYFGSKEGLFRSILREAGELQERMIHKVMSSGKGPLEKIKDLLKEVYLEVVKEPYLFLFLHRVFFFPPSIVGEEDIEPFYYRMVSSLEQLVHEGISAGQMEDLETKDVALLFMALLSLSVDVDLCYPRQADPDRLERLFHLALGGLLPRGFRCPGQSSP